MAPQPRATRANPISIASRLEPDVMTQGTPEGDVRSLVPPTQAKVNQPDLPQVQVDQPGQPDLNFILVPQPQEEVVVPMNLVQQLTQFMQRQEHANQAKTFRFTQIEAQLADLRGRHIADQGSPKPKDLDRRNPVRQRQRHSPPRENNVRNSPKHHSSRASSSPTRDRSRSQENSKGKGQAGAEDPYRRHRSPL